MDLHIILKLSAPLFLLGRGGTIGRGADENKTWKNVLQRNDSATLIFLEPVHAHLNGNTAVLSLLA